MHFWVTAMEEDLRRHAPRQDYHPDPVSCLDRAYHQTIEATAKPVNCLGTTTACGAQLYYKGAASGREGDVVPLLYVTNLGDSQVMVLRPHERKVVFKTTEQWHWFDCPRQLGTNSPDTPRGNAVVDTLEIEPGDVVLAMSDGVTDNLWEHEIVRVVAESLVEWDRGREPRTALMSRMQFAAAELMVAAKAIAEDPFAESPYMEHAIEEGLASAGGKFEPGGSPFV
jgi:protein phosphatase PTC7